MQALAWIPVSHFLGSLYAAQPGFCNMLIDTVFSLAAALFAFVILPAGDFIIGQEPPEAVNNLSIPLSIINGISKSFLHILPSYLACSVMISFPELCPVQPCC